MPYDLNQYGGDRWLSTGNYQPARVTSHKVFTANSGNVGVELTFMTPQGQSKMSVMVMEKCMWRWAKIADDMGMDEEDKRGFVPEKATTFFQGFTCGIVVGKDRSGEYHEVKDTFKIGEEPDPVKEKAHGNGNDKSGNGGTPASEIKDEDIPF